MQKTVNHYHPVTKEYLGSSTAEESPLEPGVYMVPANATLDPLPAFDAEKQLALYRPEYYATGIEKEQGGAWRIMALAEPVTEPAADAANVEQGKGA